MFFRAALAASAVLGLAVSTQGQGRNPRAAAMPPMIQLMPIQLEGTVAGVRPGMIGVTTAAGETWALKIPPKAEVRVTGTAELSVLRPGMYVRFLAAVDKRRSLAQGKVEKLTVFSPSQELGRMPGVFYAGQEGDEAAMQPGPGVRPNPPQGRNPGGRPNRPKGRDGRVPPKAAPAGRDADARGKTAANVVKGRWLTVYARNTFFKPTLRIELADKPVVNLDVNTYTLAKSGDKISARGVQIAPQVIQAMQVAIELAEPLGEPGKTAGRTIGKRPPRGPRKGSDDRQPFEVAEEIEKDKPDQPKETPPQQKPEKPLPQDKRSKELVQFLQAKPEDVKGKPGVTLNLAEGDPIQFAPCKQLPGKEVLGRFGLPDQVQKIKGSLPLGEGGQEKEIQWQLWIYGPVMFFVDEAGTTRYLTVRVDKKPQPKPQPKPEPKPQPKPQQQQAP
jgi:hypothetical protein